MNIKDAMPHENVNFDNVIQGYDAMAECLIIMKSSTDCSSQNEEHCSTCKNKIISHGFNDISWNAYRNWMAGMFPERFKLPITPENVRESTRIFMAFMRNRLPIFDRNNGNFVGYYNRSEGKLESNQLGARTASWTLSNCRFSHN